MITKFSEFLLTEKINEEDYDYAPYMNKGFDQIIYILSNKKTFGTSKKVKIGLTTGKIDKRLSSLNTAVGSKFDIETLFFVKNANKAENIIHKELAEYNTDESKNGNEFFFLNPYDATYLVEEILKNNNIEYEVDYGKDVKLRNYKEHKRMLNNNSKKSSLGGGEETTE